MTSAVVLRELVEGMDFLTIDGCPYTFALLRIEREIAEALATVGADTEDCEEDDWVEEDDPVDESAAWDRYSGT